MMWQYAPMYPWSMNLVPVVQNLNEKDQVHFWWVFEFVSLLCEDDFCFFFGKNFHHLFVGDQLFFTCLVIGGGGVTTVLGCQTCQLFLSGVIFAL